MPIFIEQLERMSQAEVSPSDATGASPEPAAEPDSAPQGAACAEADATVERELRPGEVSLEELERAFQETDGPEGIDISADAAAAVAAEAAGTVSPAAEQGSDQVAPAAAQDGDQDQGKQARDAGAKEGSLKSQSIRVNVDTLEHLMTMVSELVLTRNQLLEMVRRLDDSEFKVPRIEDFPGREHWERSRKRFEEWLGRNDRAPAVELSLIHI